LKVFINKNIFILFLLISIVWHILLALLVNVVVVPAHTGPVSFSQTNFLGAILEETAFEIKRCSEPVYDSARYKELLVMDNVNSLLSGYVRKTEVLADMARVLIEPEFDKVVLLKKSIEAGLRAEKFLASRYALKTVTYSTDQMEVEGILSGRRLLYSPELPARPEWLDKLEGGFKVRCKIGVSDEGLVTSAVVLGSSGRPALDMLTLSHLRSWRFIPKPEKDRSANGCDSGVVVVKFQ